MSQDVERLWRFAVAAEAAERSGWPDHARELRSRFNRAVERQPHYSPGTVTNIGDYAKNQITFWEPSNPPYWQGGLEVRRP